MDSKRKLFRRAALDKKASPERLDEMMEVTAPAGWIALLALGALLAAAVLWGFVGRIPIKVPGQGVLLRGEEALYVTSGRGGRLTEVSDNDFVKKGEVVAVISQPDLEPRIGDTRAKLETLKRQSREQNETSERIVRLLRDQQQELQAKVEALEELHHKGLANRFSHLDARAEISRLDQVIAEEEAKRSARRNLVDDVERELSDLERQLKFEERSPYEGRVLEVMVAQDALVEPGTRLLKLEAPEEAVGPGSSRPAEDTRWSPIKAILYVPVAEGKRIEEEMEVLVSPSTVRAEEYGLIRGVVESASRHAVEPESMARTLGNEKLVQTLTGGGPVIEVQVLLHPSPFPDRQFEWTSSSKEPPPEVSTGTICSAFVTLEEKRPLSYVLPLFKQVLAGG